MTPGKDYIGIGCGAVIVNENDEILLLQRTNGQWGKPGGKIEFGETIEDGVKREVLEEIGCEPYDLQFLRCFDWFVDDEHWIGIEFVAKIEGEPKVMEPDKFQAIAWKSIDDLPENTRQVTTVDAVAAYKQWRIQRFKT